MPGRTYSSGGYRFGYQRHEKDNEIFGEGNSLNFGARIYDPRVAKWLSLDPLERKYPQYSPYSFAGNSPILMCDVDGRVVILSFVAIKSFKEHKPVFSKLSGKELQEAQKNLINIINNGLGGQFEVKLTALGTNGSYKIDVVATAGGGDLTKLSAEQAAFYNRLTQATNDQDHTIYERITNNSNAVSMGSYKMKTIDVGQMSEYPSISEKTKGGTQQGFFIHEITEQYSAAKNKANMDDADKFEANFSRDHNEAVKAENEVNGNERLPDKGSQGKIGSYTMMYKEKDGSITTQTSTSDNGKIVDIQTSNTNDKK